MPTTLNHILIAVNDLESARSQYQSLMGTQSRRLTDLEFLGCSVQQFALDNCCINLCQSTTGSRWSKLVDQKLKKSGGGVFGFILGSDNFFGYTQHCIANGIDVSPITIDGANPGISESNPSQLVELIADGLDGFSVFAQSIDNLNIQNINTPSTLATPKVDAISSLDHLVINSSGVNALIPIFQTLGMNLRLDQTVEAWGFRQLFYRAGDCIIEVIESITPSARPLQNEVWGLAYQVESVDELLLRLSSLNILASDSRKGRKKGTVVSTLKSHNLGIATLLIDHTAARI